MKAGREKSPRSALGSVLLGLSFLLVTGRVIAASFIIGTSATTERTTTHTIPTGSYQPRATNGVVAVQSASVDTGGDFRDNLHEPPEWLVSEFCIAQAATYGSDTSIEGGQHPGLLGLAVEPMAEAVVTASGHVSGGPKGTSAGGRAYAVAEVRHQVVARKFPDHLQEILGALATVPVRLNYRVSVTTRTHGIGEFYSNSRAFFQIQGPGLQFSDMVNDYSLGDGDGGTIEDTRSFQLRLTRNGQTNLYLIKASAESIISVGVSSPEPDSSAGASITGQVIVDPFLYLDPQWEYAPYFAVQQESLRNPGSWAEVTRGWQAVPPTAGAGSSWWFELEDGMPARLVWPTEAGRTYDLWSTADWSVPFVHVEGFPKAGTGEPMKHVLPAGGQRFFRMSTDDGSVPIPGGEFLMGDQTAPNYEGAVAERPQHAVNLRPFVIARFEVTKALWDVVARWAETNGYDLSAASASGKRSDHPVHGVTWEEGLKWCNARSEKEGLSPCYTAAGSPYRTGPATAVTCDFHADGYRLPTEAEWEMAARGGTSGRRYPWGTDTISHAEANYEAEGTGYGNLSGDAGYHPTWRNGATPYTSPVGSFPGNGYGLHDLAGNLWEWCWDWYGENYYAVSASTNPAGPGEGSKRVIRGGGWVSTGPGDCRVAARDSVVPTASFNDVGFRPVRTVPTPGP